MAPTGRVSLPEAVVCFHQHTFPGIKKRHVLLALQDLHLGGSMVRYSLPWKRSGEHNMIYTLQYLPVMWQDFVLGVTMVSDTMPCMHSEVLCI